MNHLEFLIILKEESNKPGQGECETQICDNMEYLSFILALGNVGTFIIPCLCQTLFEIKINYITSLNK